MLGLFGGGYPVYQSVIVNTKTGKAFRGILWAKKRDVLVLKDAEISRGGGQWAQVDGEIYVDRLNVDFLQALVKGIAT